MELELSIKPAVAFSNLAPVGSTGDFLRLKVPSDVPWFLASAPSRAWSFASLDTARESDYSLRNLPQLVSDLEPHTLGSLCLSSERTFSREDSSLLVSTWIFVLRGSFSQVFCRCLGNGTVCGVVEGELWGTRGAVGCTACSKRVFFDYKR